MPSERFFYRPVDPNYGAIGQGIGYGVEAGVGNFYAEKERMRQRGREDVEDERAATDSQIERDLFFTSQGGGSGAPPPRMNAPQLDFGSPGMAGGRGAGNIIASRGQEFDFTPREGPVMQAAGDPNFDRYISVGPEGTGYIENPQWKERQDIEKARNEQVADRAALNASLMSRGASPEQAGSDSYLVERDIATFNQVDPTPGGSSGRDPGRMTLTQANKYVDEKYRYQTDDTYEGEWEYPNTAEERLAEAQAIARGQIDPTAMDGNEVAGAGVSPLGGPTMSFEELIDPGRGITVTGGGGSREAAPPIDDETVKQVHLELARFDPETWPDVLAQMGFTPPEIQRILGK